MAMEPVRIALLGSGFVAEFYMQGLKDVGHHDVVVVAARNPDRASS
jgi:predicted dehydrogenase